MIYLGITKSGERLYRAPSLMRAEAFAELFDAPGDTDDPSISFVRSRVQYGVILHKWYVIL